MPEFSFVLLYVTDPAASAGFYSDLLGVPVVEQSPTFAMLPLRPGVTLGLWIRSGVEPAAGTATGGSEFAWTVADAAAVAALHADWAARGVTIAQTPVRMDFGMTFTTLDPDGHRLRVFSPGS